MKLAVLVTLCLAAAMASDQVAPTLAPSPEAAVRQADEPWVKAIASKSVEQTVALYDAEASTAGSAMPPARGLAGIRAMWAKLFAKPNFFLTWKTDKVVVTESGTMASSTGSWRGAKPNETGPFLAVWRKQRDGAWKVLIDAAWNSRTPE
jgi:ketosteroid isomerase-like protein